MATRNISRSALEGGRRNYNKYERRQSNSQERARLKVWLSSVDFDSEFSERRAPKARRPVRKEFTDKLAPCWGWLASRCGRPWNSVHSELRKTFDTRKLSSWHIVHQHMLKNISGAGTDWDGYKWITQRFVIDEEGILRDRGKDYRNRTNSYTGPTLGEARESAAGRAVSHNEKTGEVRWSVPIAYEWRQCLRPSRCHISTPHEELDTTPASCVALYTESETHRSWKDSDHWRVRGIFHQIPVRWKKGPVFTQEELVWWSSLAPYIQEKLMEDDKIRAWLGGLAK